MIVCIIVNIISSVISCFYFSFKNFYGVFTIGSIIEEYISYLIIFLIVNSIMFFIKHLFNDEDEDEIAEIIKNKNTIRWWLIQLFSYIITLVIMHIILL